MELRLHKNARTTPAVRAEIAASTEGVSALSSDRLRVMRQEGEIYAESR
ncbi:MAG: hypothetical protein LBU11_09225 [Zoogloeaceae bacterium]|jgi:hypothetical protein|nr:hypothetical protein [Zoogloeaceae bacterium]